MYSTRYAWKRFSHGVNHYSFALFVIGLHLIWICTIARIFAQQEQIGHLLEILYFGLGIALQMVRCMP